MASPISSPQQAQQITKVANPWILNRQKKKKNPIQSKSLNPKPQITKSKITNANLKKKTSTKQCLMPQAQANRWRSVTSLARLWKSLTSLEFGPAQSTLPHQRSVMMLTRHRRSLADWRSLVAHPSLEIARHYLNLSLQASLLWCSIKVFHFTNFSLFFSLTLSQSLNLSLFI